jgi:hypothetical protein
VTRYLLLAVAEAASPQLSGSEQAVWLTRLEREHDNARAAMRWQVDRGIVDQALRMCAALWRFWQWHGHMAEGRERLTEVLEESATASSAGNAAGMRAEVLRGAGTLAAIQGDFATARSLTEESLAIRRELGVEPGVAASLCALGEQARYRGTTRRRGRCWRRA